mgnify:CR=1 FL=1
MDCREGICDVSRNGLQSQHLRERIKMVSSFHSITYLVFPKAFLSSFHNSALYQFLEKKNSNLKSTVLSVGRDASALFSFQFITVNDFDGNLTISVLDILSSLFSVCRR